MASDLELGVGELKKFRDSVDGVIKDLEAGAGGASKLGQKRVTRGSFGTGMAFAEADGFFTEYERIHHSLVALSKSLSGQIELLQIGVHAANVGYANVEDEQRRRFHDIQARLDKERDEAIEREQQAKDRKPEQPAQTSQDAASAEKDLG
ncbi:hypothetical protein GCM10010363_16130 [Streptomyces omiyaensis]|uniref:hypothetical protein n=1 Tax=Streptomyces omiyaensis TaxID=68247 RepID=UPI00198D0B00|nr:hypothetical protein [Streptomyces omiyaensis]GGY35892.1 hypothetical protein GCM10010363_16130 [Streptomyces omiyaensis]